MSKAVREEVNFWPGYVDALVNVVLNLLFLVGVFTIGLVSLNMEVVLAEQKLARLKVEHMLEKDLSAESKKRALALLDKLTPKPRAQPEVATHAQPEIREVILKASHDTPTPQTAAPQQTPAQLALTASGGKRVLAQFAFHKDQFAFSGNEHALSTLAENNASDKILLMVITDTTNPRLAQEAFSRLVSTRTALLQNGMDAKNISLRVIPSSQITAHPAEIEHTVFAVQLSH
jgi:hypothetical protein